MKERIGQLQQLLLTNDPQMPILCERIHGELQKFDELALLLDEDELGVVVKGLTVITAVEINTTEKKGKPRGKRLNEITVDDI